MALIEKKFLVLSFILALIFNQACGDDNLIHQTCAKTQYNDLCVSTLLSAPSTSTSDLNGLVKFFIDTSQSIASKVLLSIHHLRSKKGDQTTLTACAFSYNAAANVLDDARLYLASKNYTGVHGFLDQATSQVLRCENLLKSKGIAASELIENSDTFVHLGSIGQTIVGLIH